MLENWFQNNVVKLNNFYENIKDFQFGKKIIHLTDQNKPLNDNSIVIVSDNSNIAEKVRMELWQMEFPWHDITIVDLGLFRNTSVDFLSNIFNQFINANIKCICLSSDAQVEEAFKQSLISNKGQYEGLYITSKSEETNAPNDDESKITYLGLQGHLSPILKHQQIFNIRLGNVKSNIFDCEPFCRKQDFAVWSINVMKYLEMPGHVNLGPAGFESEEITKIFRYLGFSDQLKGIFIKDYLPESDTDNQGAKLIAQCVWYYLDALNHCMKEDLHMAEDYTEFAVAISELEEPLVFILGKKTGRWWMKDLAADTLVPCSESDYNLACQNEIPNRLFL